MFDALTISGDGTFVSLSTYATHLKLYVTVDFFPENVKNKEKYIFILQH